MLILWPCTIRCQDEQILGLSIVIEAAVTSSPKAIQKVCCSVEHRPAFDLMQFVNTRDISAQRRYGLKNPLGGVWGPEPLVELQL